MRIKLSVFWNPLPFNNIFSTKTVRQGIRFELTRNQWDGWKHSIQNISEALSKLFGNFPSGQFPFYSNWLQIFTKYNCNGPQPWNIFAKTLHHTHHGWELQRLLTQKYLNIFWRRNGFKHVLASTLSNNSLFYFVSSSIEYFEDFSIKRWLNSTQWKTCIHYESTMETTSSLITTGIISHLAYNKISPQKMILRGMNPLISQVIPYFSFHLISSPLTASRNYLFTQYGVPERRHHNIFVL